MSIQLRLVSLAVLAFAAGQLVASANQFSTPFLARQPTQALADSDGSNLHFSGQGSAADAVGGCDTDSDCVAKFGCQPYSYVDNLCNPALRGISSR